jgi:predicted Zn-dependent protease
VISSAVASPSDEVFLPVGELAGQFADMAASSVEDDRAAMSRKVDALLQSRQLGAARDLLEQCQEKWPDEPQFAKALALVYATFGRPADAVRMLQRYLAARPDAAESVMLAVEWLYALRAAGRSLTSAVEDLELARAYAAKYRQLNGPEIELVQLWLDFMSSAP